MTQIGARQLAFRVAAWSGSVIFAWLSATLVASELGFGVDSHAYWAAWRGEMYDGAPATRDAFLYSPAFAQAIWPLAQLPWPAFAVLWGLAASATIAWLASGAGWAWFVPISLLGTLEVLTGNVNWVLALVAVFGLRHPGLWTIALLTKVTPALGPLWFLARGEWRKLAHAAGWAVAVTLVSFAVSPDLWRGWLEFLSVHAGSSSGKVGSAFLPPLTIRLPLVAALIIWGARTDRVWTVPVGMALVSPVSGIGQLVVVLAVPQLLRRKGAETAPPPRPRRATPIRRWPGPRTAAGR
ncbi:glycosyltransferase family 87 protein [Nocardia sp. N13]|uniref:glycosyltransferase family 87 protein n=1 Tax=Nocardioides sp. N13(2025) TaxID=3453405 RepID=UPI003F75D06B